MEVLTEVPQSGTRLRIDADRQFDAPLGDSTLRIQGQTTDGSPVMDATYVEVSADEAKLVGWFLRAVRQPPPELLERIGQEVQSVFGSKLDGRDAHQAAELAWHGVIAEARQRVGTESRSLEQIAQIAERFERAAARSESPYASSQTMTGSKAAAGRN